MAVQTETVQAPIIVKTLKGRTPAPDIQRLDNQSPVAEAIVDASTLSERQAANAMATAAMAADRRTNLEADPVKPTRPLGLDKANATQLAADETTQWRLDSNRIAGAALSQEVLITARTTPAQAEVVAADRTRAVEAEQRRTVERPAAGTEQKTQAPQKAPVPNEPTDALNISGDPVRPGPGAAVAASSVSDLKTGYSAKASGVANAPAAPAAAAERTNVADALFASVKESIAVGRAVESVAAAPEISSRPIPLARFVQRMGIEPVEVVEAPRVAKPHLEPTFAEVSERKQAIAANGQPAINGAPAPLQIENKPGDTLGNINARKAADEPEFASVKPAPQPQKPWVQSVASQAPSFGRA